MPAVKPEALRKSLSSGTLGGVFFFHGEEEYLIDEATNDVVNAHIDPAMRDFNYDQLRGGDSEVEAIASVLQTPPMMAEWRVVVVRDAHALAGNNRGRALLEDLLDRTPPGLAVVLQAQIPDRSAAKIYDKLKKQARSVEFAGLSDADLPGWLMARAKSDGIVLDPEAARLLASGDAPLGVLVRELEKLRDYVGDRKQVNAEDVEKLVGPGGARQNRWQWFDMVADRRFREARNTLASMLDTESGVGLVLGLGTQFLRLAIGASGGEKALEGTLPPHQRWLAGRVMKQARGWTENGLKECLNDLLRADRLLKSSSLSDEQVLQELLLRMEVRALRETRGRKLAKR